MFLSLPLKENVLRWLIHTLFAKNQACTVIEVSDMPDSLILNFWNSIKSLTHTKNNTGPKSEPCRHPWRVHWAWHVLTVKQDKFNNNFENNVERVYFELHWSSWRLGWHYLYYFIRKISSWMRIVSWSTIIFHNFLELFPILSFFPIHLIWSKQLFRF